eukprot:6074403-Amphidinium_carterae.1
MVDGAPKSPNSPNLSKSAAVLKPGNIFSAASSAAASSQASQLFAQHEPPTNWMYPTRTK